jgi:hypothetical protein
MRINGSISVDQPGYVYDLVDDIWFRSDIELIDPSDFSSRVAKVMSLVTKSRPNLLHCLDACIEGFETRRLMFDH